MAEHNDLGKWGEEVARHYLLMHDYHIWEKDWHSGHRDLDIVAEKLGFLIFIEVKTRSSDSFASPEDAINTEKIQNLLSAANAYINMKNLKLPCQFDVITIVGNQDNYKINHIKRAFDAFNYNGRYEYKGISPLSSTQTIS